MGGVGQSGSWALIWGFSTSHILSTSFICENWYYISSSKTAVANIPLQNEHETNNLEVYNEDVKVYRLKWIERL